MLMWNPRFLSLFPLRRAATASRESIFFISKFFKTLLKNLPQCTMGFACATFLGHLCISRFPGRARVSGPVLDRRAWFLVPGPPRWWKINPDYVASNIFLQKQY